MKKTMLRLTALVMLMEGLVSVAIAQSTKPINVVTSAVPFLRISPDARSGGMGDVGIATIPDANAAFWNLAKTPFAKNNAGISATYTPWLHDLGLNDVYLASLAGYYKLDDMQALSASLRYFSLGNIQFTDANGANLQSFRPREFAFDAGYSRKLSKTKSIGVALRYINSQLAKGDASGSGTIYKAGSSVAGDIHYFSNGIKDNGEGFSWGVTLSNLGAKIGYTSNNTQKDFIPANLGIGGAYSKVFDADNKITFGLDINKLMVPTPPTTFDSAALVKYRSKGVVSSWFSSIVDGEDIQELQISVGAEYWYKNQFALRLGYFYENPQKGDRKYLTAGAGFKYNVLGLNFSYLLPAGSGVNRNPLSNTIRFSLLFDIDNETEKTNVKTK